MTGPVSSGSQFRVPQSQHPAQLLGADLLVEHEPQGQAPRLAARPSLVSALASLS